MIKIFTAFSGYDSQCLALKYLGYEFELVGWSEIDKHAIQAHNALFPQYADRNYGDISKIDWAQVPDFELFTYSFPCTDISISGKQAGLAEGSGTRSSLLWECRRAIEIKQPKYLLMENVKALVTRKYLPHFAKWLAYLEQQGYQNFTQVLNAKDYGIPQNRERVFVVSMLGGGEYSFPKPIPLERKLKDMMEERVDEKYYLNQEKVDTFIAQFSPEKLKMLKMENKPNVKIIGKINSSQDGKIITKDSVVPCLTSGHSNCPKIIEDLWR